MDIQKDLIKTIGTPVIITANQNIETDFILPDYYDTIGKLIKTSVEPLCESVNVSGDKISVSGSAVITLLYSGEDNRLYQYESSFKYSKMLQYDNCEASDSVDIRQEVLNLSYRVIGPKRVEVKSQVRISALILQSNNTEMISAVSDSDIEVKHQMIEAENCELVTIRDFIVTGKDLSIDENIRFVLRKECRIDISEVKSVSNKVYLRGNAVIDTVCLTENENIVKKYSFNLPISEVVDFYGVTEDSLCRIDSVTPQLSINIVSNENACSLDASLQIFIRICSLGHNGYNFITDAYALKDEIVSEYKMLEMELKRETITKTHSVSFEAELPDSENYTISDVFADNVIITASVRDENIDYVLNADYNALLKSEKGMYNLIIRNNTTDFSVDCKGENKQIINVDKRLLSISALRVSDSKVKFSADFSVTIELVEKCKVNVLTNITAISVENESFDSSVVLYYASKGESVWDIGKENKVSVRNIKSNNGLTDDYLNEDKVLMFSNF